MGIEQSRFVLYTIHNCSYDGQCTEKNYARLLHTHAHKIRIWNNRAVNQIGNNTNFGGFIVFWVVTVTIIITMIMQPCQVK